MKDVDRLLYETLAKKFDGKYGNNQISDEVTVAIIDYFKCTYSSATCKPSADSAHIEEMMSVNSIIARAKNQTKLHTNFSSSQKKISDSLYTLSKVVLNKGRMLENEYESLLSSTIANIRTFNSLEVFEVHKQIGDDTLNSLINFDIQPYYMSPKVQSVADELGVDAKFIYDKYEAQTSAAPMSIPQVGAFLKAQSCVVGDFGSTDKVDLKQKLTAKKKEWRLAATRAITDTKFAHQQWEEKYLNKAHIQFNLP